MTDDINTESPVSSPGQHENYIVAIGTSAGGLDALKGFFSNVPDDCPHSFVIVQHLSPDYKSLMSELLGKTTRLPIYEVTDKMQVKGGCVYLIPPSKNMTYKNTRLHLTDKPRGHGLNLPVDIFFESLAEAVSGRAVGIILSGTGSDGTRGVRAIKEAGGMVMVQDPRQAAFDGMPQSAIRTGLVDFILPVEQLPGELLLFIQHPTTQQSAEKRIEQNESALGWIINHIHNVTHLDFSHYKRPTLARRILRRMGINKCESLQDYINFFTQNPREVQTLAREFLIGVTKFFRNAEIWQILEKEVLTDLVRIAAENSLPIKVWSVGCSTGEEAYTLAMLISEEMERQDKRLEVKIFATDIMKDFLDIASKGTYPESIVADISPQRLQTFFIHQGEEYQVKDSLRRMIIFSHHNILQNPPFNKMDLVVCRNLLIYIQPKMQQQIMNTLHFALKLNGALMLGSSESIGEHRNAFQEIDKKARLYRNIQIAVRIRDELLHSPAFKGVVPYHPQTRHRASAENLMSEVMINKLVERLGVASVYIDQNFNILHAIGDVYQFFKVPERGFSTNLLKLLPSNLSTLISLELHKAMRQDETGVCEGMTLQKKNETILVDAVIQPFVMTDFSTQPCILVLFIPKPVQQSSGSTTQDLSVSVPDALLQKRNQELETELREMQFNLQATLEEMEASNEELQAANEELLAANEELQSTNEELQSVNEELHTVNAEYQLKMEEVSELNTEMDNLFTSTEIGTIFLDRELYIRKFTPAAREQFNLISGDTGRPITDLASHFGAAIHKSLLNSTRQVISTNQSHQLEVQTNNGHWYLMRITPYHNNKGPTEGAVINFIDIDGLKKTEAALEESEKKYRALYENSPDMLLSIDSTTREILNCNMTLVNRLGYDNKEELVGRSALDIYHPDGYDKVAEVFKNYHKTGRAENVELTLITKQGDKRIAMVNANAIRDENGKILYSNSVWRDITKIRQTEEALQISETLFKNLFEQASIGLAQVVPGTGFIRMNQYFCDMLGYSQEELLGKKASEITHPDDAQANETNRQSLIDHEINSYNWEKRYIRKDQSMLWVNQTTSIINIPGQPDSVFLFVADITEQKRLALELQKQRDELKRHNEDLQHFAYIASHDLQEPLRTVSSFTELLTADYRDQLDQTGQDFIHFIQEATVRMSQQINALLEYSRIGKQSAITEVNCQQLIKSILSDLSSMITDNKISFQIESLPSLPAYETELRLLFQNLITNAIKYRKSDQTTLVQISAERQEHQWQFAVQDNGIGIEAKYLARIFIIFQRLHTRNEYEGTGIGLAQCKKIVELHGGEIWAESQPDVGSTFYFTIPDRDLTLDQDQLTA